MTGSSTWVRYFHTLHSYSSERLFKHYHRNRHYPSSIRRPRTVRRYSLRRRRTYAEDTSGSFRLASRGRLPDDEPFLCSFSVYTDLLPSNAPRKMVLAAQVTRMNRRFDVVSCMRLS
jgi:hypothetical protein